MNIDHNYIVKIRRELHQVPEVGFELPKTLSIIRRELTSIGLPYREDIGRSCIIATLNEGVGNKTIALRADFDALPMAEETGLPFVSRHPGKMHACGHDCHAAMLLGTAKALKAMEKDIKCCVKFVFQSAEEILGGAKSICETGFMDYVDVILGCHIFPDSPAGTVALNRSCDSACSRGFKIHLYGKSSHVSRPDLGVDAIAMAVRVYSDIQLMRARELNPFDPVIIGIGAFNGGEAANIVCDYVVMTGTIRTQSTELSGHIYQRICDIAEAVAADMGGKAQVETLRYSPALHNDLKVADDIEAAAKKTGFSEVLPKEDSMGGEDFAYFLEYKPGAMFGIGIKPKDAPVIPLHNGKLIIDEDALSVAPKVYIQYILDQMEK
ncbi:MAG: amidohydrolase [Oscillospiraceae bacterium]|nr:amidohydrolase [Oscillospiraceae bacterium]